MTYQQFDEKLQGFFELTPERERKVRARWQRMSRRGPLVFILTRGSLLFLWTLLCLAFFSWRLHTLHLYRDAFALIGTLVALLSSSFLAPAAGYLGSRSMAANLDRRELQRSQKLLRRRRHFAATETPLPNTSHSR